MARMEIRGMESLYIEAMDELLAKDVAFFHNNFAGSLTKRALGYAKRFEDVFDVLCFSLSAKPHFAGLRGRGAVVVFATADPRAARTDGGDAGDHLPADSQAPAAGGRPRGRFQHSGRTRRGLDRQRR